MLVEKKNASDSVFDITFRCIFHIVFNNCITINRKIKSFVKLLYELKNLKCCLIKTPNSPKDFFYTMVKINISLLMVAISTTTIKTQT